MSRLIAIMELINVIIFLLLIKISPSQSLYCSIGLKKEISLSASSLSIDSNSLLDTEKVLTIVRNTSNGIKLDSTQKMIVENWIDKQNLEYMALNASRSALEDSRLLGNYDVAYVGVGGSQEGNPAGGGYRGRLGRAIYRNEGLYQHILPSENSSADATVVNYIRGTLLGLLTLNVILKGKACRLPDERRQQLVSKYGTPLSAGTVCAEFGPPILGLSWRHKSSAGPGKCLALQLGSPSDVVLDTTFLSDQVRLGRGSRGSTFIFARTQDPAAELYKAVLAQPPVRFRDIRGVAVAMAALALSFRIILCRPAFLVNAFVAIKMRLMLFLALFSVHRIS